ncbi:hypothetical protein ABIA39_002789 [Nocardia sp. GAS34]|uniref:AbiTii domain-containing protein n=1 Tax=unclassified Nocardia TaxID=2637762 RepID=UPI003D1D2EA3
MSKGVPVSAQPFRAGVCTVTRRPVVASFSPWLMPICSAIFETVSEIEHEPLAGLLRKCLMLGAVTGSDDLRLWASRKLKGYGDNDPLPAYRMLAAPLYVEVSAGPYRETKQLSRFSVPADLREYVPEKLCITDPVEKLAVMAGSSDEPITMGLSGFPILAAEWTKLLEWPTAVRRIYFQVLTPTLVGLLGTVRTALLEMVMDMTKDLPLDELPSRGQADAAVQVHVNGGTSDQYHMHVGNNSGIVGQGPGLVQTQHNINSCAGARMMDTRSADGRQR